MSWAGKILRVDLTAGTVKSEPLKMDWARAYLGSRGLATKYIVDEVDPKVDPLSPAVVPAWSLAHLISCHAARWPPSGRKSTYHTVQFCQATSMILVFLLPQHFTIRRAADIPSLRRQQFGQQMLRADLRNASARH